MPCSDGQGERCVEVDVLDVDLRTGCKKQLHNVHAAGLPIVNKATQHDR